MVMISGGLWIGIAGWLLAGQAGPASPAGIGSERASRVERLLESPGYEHGHWGLLVVDVKSGEVLYERQADRLFAPASVTKLYSTAAALVDLGADERFHTPVVRQGEVDSSGVLRGDLILVARGDPSLGGRTGPDGALLFEEVDHSYAAGNLKASLVKGDPLAGLDQLAREVAASGIRQVSGEVWVDDRAFEAAESTGSGPSRVSPIMLNDNVIDVVVSPGEKQGDAARVRLVPATGYAQVDVQVETCGAELRPQLNVISVGPRRFAVRGRIPVGHRPVVKIWEVDDPASLARTALIERLLERGVRTGASPLGSNERERLPSRAEVAGLPKVAEYTSPPFREYAKVILKVSQNLHASVLPMLLGLKQNQTTLSAGLLRQGEVLKGIGIPIERISLGSGAGGSRGDLVSPRVTVALLCAMARRPEFGAFESAMPVLGVDGTLAQAVDAESPARGHARAKTGTYTWLNGLTGRPVLTSKALAGYLDTASGRSLAFAFFVNNVPLDVDTEAATEATAQAGRLLGKLCEIFYADSAGSGVPQGGTQPSGPPGGGVRSR
jgi:D-alanyl-D-alanine carboxypeptidase/D-alanyl-D-alanine-endopeptidase (penicillin-binding protein 4)